MNKRLLSLLLLLSFLFSLSACRQEEDELLVPPDDPLNAEGTLPPNEEPDARPPEEPPVENDPVPEPPVSAADWIVDTTLLTERSQTIDRVFPATDDLLLVFTSTLSDGYVSEQINLYTYSLSDRAFTGDWVSLGIVGQYPHTVYADGTVMVLTRNTETYEYESMLFIDPHALTFERHALTALEDLRSIHISPDKRLAAVSTGQGLRITDLSFEAVLAHCPGYVPEGGDPELDYILPVATGWLQDGSAVVGKLLSWEWVHHPFLLAADGQMTLLDAHMGLTALPYGDDLLLCDSFTMIPHGLIGPDGSGRPALELQDLPRDDGSAYLSALSCDGGNELLGLAIATPDGQDACRADFYHRGRLLTRLTLPQNGAFPVTFDSITFTPDGHKAILMTGATVDYPAAIHIQTLD